VREIQKYEEKMMSRGNEQVLMEKIQELEESLSCYDKVHEGESQ
jgi:hypothetical protein